MTNFLLETPGVKITRIRCCSHEYDMVDTDATKGMNNEKRNPLHTPHQRPDDTGIWDILWLDAPIVSSDICIGRVVFEMDESQQNRSIVTSSSRENVLLSDPSSGTILRYVRLHSLVKESRREL